MTFKELNTMVKSIGLPSNYYQWPMGNVPALPYILFYYPSRDDFFADGVNYAKKTLMNIELYSQEKDFELEEQVETILEENGIAYDKEEQYISDERMYEVLYTMEVIINGKG